MIHNASTQLISDAWDYKIFIQITLDFPNSTLLFGALGGLLIMLGGTELGDIDAFRKVIRNAILVSRQQNPY